mmetsp:Transcript_53557/g.127652  ORF Transcript_53557/g.127652 Transcript_53557/m.127652 type:complete len:141 (-) Transcript_53557:213-635(-)
MPSLGGRSQAMQCITTGLRENASIVGLSSSSGSGHPRQIVHTGIPCAWSASNIGACICMPVFAPNVWWLKIVMRTSIVVRAMMVDVQLRTHLTSRVAQMNFRSTSQMAKEVGDVMSVVLRVGIGRKTIAVPLAMNEGVCP